ncbi:PIG-L domain-containing protein [Marinobacterium nitratireducens]|uniref:PIG-L domain-containing protein n=1 Tax=Marinobacterium nitratireducens TaxID=518897 RepID=A0A917ZKB4_9GAMM|nr:PIG-L family deacetylase [Marinobacterium nitratireducens]GGO85157.1 PIG-L domain-containing protein [Marinobacterium nitratireducens]
MSKRVLVVAAHPDDEVLGCGGTIARHVAEGDTVHVLFIADGVSSRGEGKEELVKREQAAFKAHKILGVAEVSYLGLPDNRLDSLALLDVVQYVEKVINAFYPNIIYTHHFGDLNVDHCIAHQAVMTACRPLPESSVREIFAFEVLSSTDWATPQINPFIPNHYVDISKYLELKMEALEAYSLEMRDIPHSRSIDHLDILARHRGQSVGCFAAEAFSVIRLIRK